jgi:hypothetical protein
MLKIKPIRIILINPDWLSKKHRRKRWRGKLEGGGKAGLDK